MSDEALLKGPGLIATPRKHSRENFLYFNSLSAKVTAVLPRHLNANQPNEFMISTNVSQVSARKDTVFIIQSAFWDLNGCREV